MINLQAKGNIEIETTDNGTFIIKATLRNPVIVSPAADPSVLNRVGGNRQYIFTANTLDEVMIIAREQLEKAIAEKEK